jgi:hypothetical protein
MPEVLRFAALRGNSDAPEHNRLGESSEDCRAKAKGRTPLRVLALSIRYFEDLARHPDHNVLQLQCGKGLQASRPRFLYPPSSLPLHELSQFHPNASSFLNALLSSVAGSPDDPSSLSSIGRFLLRCFEY